jgi:segregation and condensation protein B
METVMDRNETKAIIENILFVSDAPLTIDKLVKLFEEKQTADELKSIIIEIRDEYQTGALRISEVAEGWRMTTNQEYAAWIKIFFKMEKGHKLSRASLETLAIIAYRQPITRAEVDDIRGVDSGGVLRGLIDKTMVKTMGRRKVPGRPMMYGTTNRFLEFFGLARLADLPTLEEFQAELGGDALDDKQAAIEFAPEQGAEEPDEIEDDAELAGEAEDDDIKDEDESVNVSVNVNVNVNEDDDINDEDESENVNEDDDTNETDESEDQADEHAEVEENEILNETEEIS